MVLRPESLRLLLQVVSFVTAILALSRLQRGSRLLELSGLTDALQFIDHLSLLSLLVREVKSRREVNAALVTRLNLL